MLINFRNPFNMIGKVFKYEFINTAKILVPLYAILFVLGVFSGLISKPLDINDNTIFEFSTPNKDFIIPYDESPSTPDTPKQNFNETNSTVHSIKYQKTPADYSFNIQTSQNLSMLNLIKGFMGTSFVILLQIILIVTFIILGRRFKKGLFEDEAYLNFSLPVTIGEHLWGRLLCYLTWILICYIIMTLSFGVSVIKLFKIEWIKSLFANINRFIQNKYIIYFQFALISIVLPITIIGFIFFINCVGHIFKKETTLAKVVTVIITLGLFGKISGSFFNISYLKNIEELSKGLWLYILSNTVFSTVFLSCCHYILAKHLNLE